MTSSAPQIGFDRFVHVDWVRDALHCRAGRIGLAELEVRLVEAGLGSEARIKTRTKLNALWLAPRADLVEFAAAAVEIFESTPQASPAALSWGMSLASYPFFGAVAEWVGRLTSLHGECSSAEIHRRISEAFGQREVTKRATQAVLQTMVNWQLLDRTGDGRRFMRTKPVVITDDRLLGWLIEAALRYADRSVAVSTLNSLAPLFPFVFDRPLEYLVSNNVALEVRCEGMGDRRVSLRGL